jgi:hypothetical protein
MGDFSHNIQFTSAGDSVALDTYVIAQCRYSHFYRVREVNINAFISDYSDLSEKYK